jgi:integrase
MTSTVIGKRRPGRPSTGTWRKYMSKGQWVYEARITFAGGRRPWWPLPHVTTDDEAVAAARVLATEAKAGRLDLSRRRSGGQSKQETLSEYSVRWLEERRRAGHLSVIDDVGRIRKWILPRLGHYAIAMVKKEQIEDMALVLSDSVRAAEIHWSTAGNVWALITKMFSDAHNHEGRDLRVRDDNPAAGVRGPKKGSGKAKVFLYPAEFTRLVSCASVPLKWRRIFAITVYMQLRDQELRALSWPSIDLDRGVVSIFQAWSHEKRMLTAPKGNGLREFVIEEGLLPLLRQMRGERREGETIYKGHVIAGGLLIVLPEPNYMAKRLRHYLQIAGVERQTLFLSDPRRKRMTFHDLRATGITWRAVRGDNPLAIQEDAGHDSFSTTQMYVRTARKLGGVFGDVFPPLPGSLLESFGDRA